MDQIIPGTCWSELELQPILSFHVGVCATRTLLTESSPQCPSPAPGSKLTLHCSSFTRNMQYMTVYDDNLDLYFYGNQDKWGRLRLLKAKMVILRGPVRQKSRHSPLQHNFVTNAFLRQKQSGSDIKECLTDYRIILILQRLCKLFPCLYFLISQQGTTCQHRLFFYARRNISIHQFIGSFLTNRGSFEKSKQNLAQQFTIITIHRPELLKKGKREMGPSPQERTWLQPTLCGPFYLTENQDPLK